MEKPAVLIIENSIHVTGALKAILRSALPLADRFRFVFVIPAKSVARKAIEQHGFEQVMELPMRELNRNPVRMMLYWPCLMANTWRLRKIVTAEQIRLIHNNDLYNLLPFFLRLTGARVPYVCHIRFLPDKFPGILFRFWLFVHFKSASTIIAVSRHVLQSMRHHAKLRLIYDSVPHTETPLANHGSREKVVLYLAQIIRGKGQEHALYAFARVAETNPDWTLRFVGGDMGLQKNRIFWAELRQLAAALKIEAKVEWKDFEDEVEAEYSRCGFLVNFSESESFSMTCLEALYYGCPVVATRCGGPEEIIIHGETGFLVAKNDIQAMSEAMNRLMSDSDLRLSFASRAAESVKARFSIVNTSRQLLECYTNAISAR